MGDWKEYYQSHCMSAKEAVSRIGKNDTVMVSHLIGASAILMDAIVENKEAYDKLTFIHMLTSGPQPWARPENMDRFQYRAIFVGGETRKGLGQPNAEFVPCNFSEVPKLFRTKMKPDTALIQCSRPDEDGYVSMGLTADYTYGGAKMAHTVIAEVNAQCPYVNGDTKMHVSEIDAFVETDHGIVEIPPTKISEIEQKIGGYCAELINDGDCLQLGLGAIPDAVLGFMKDKKDLGIHSEIIGDGVANLVKAGVINGSRKKIDVGKVVAGSLYGSKVLLDFVDHNPMVELRACDYTNDPRVICQNPNVVSINSCLQIDLMGQVNAEAIGLKQFSGVGGQVDFIRGARMSEGGRSIMTLYSTAKNDTISRIVPFLDHGAPVTTSRNDIDYVITEYGIAPLTGLSLRERAKALIKIAHPNFRDGLKEEFERRFGAWAD